MMTVSVIRSKFPSESQDVIYAVIDFRKFEKFAQANPCTIKKLTIPAYRSLALENTNLMAEDVLLRYKVSALLGLSRPDCGITGGCKKLDGAPKEVPGNAVIWPIFPLLPPFYYGSFSTCYALSAFIHLNRALASTMKRRQSPQLIHA